jgi:(p)ppGpp synthase/HD superfamily hydrolase
MITDIFRAGDLLDTIKTNWRAHIATNPDIQQALHFATEAHKGQVRKYTGLPYIAHPVEVAQITSYPAPNDPAMIMAALLHDTVEDTPVTITAVRRTFGDDVAALVNDLTDIEWEEPRPNRKARKQADRARLAKISPRAQTIKYADFLSNGADITEHDPHFAKVYLREMQATLKVMRAGHPGMLALADAMVAKNLDKIAPN